MSYAKKIFEQTDESIRIEQLRIQKLAELDKLLKEGRRLVSETNRLFTDPLHMADFRKNLHMCQGGKCYYCWHDVALENFTFDHVIPLSKGGKNSRSNRVGSCKPCNNKKDDKPVDEFMKSDWLTKRRQLLYK